MYDREFSRPFELNADPPGTQNLGKPVESRWFGLVLAPVIVAFFLSSTLGVDVSFIALVTGAVVLFIGRAHPSEIIDRVDWVLLLFLVGLFVVIGGAWESGVRGIIL